jgi:predicted phage terminase large subunit-like protein
MVDSADAAKELLARRNAKRSLVAFTKYRNPNYQAAEHHYKIAAALEAVEDGTIKRLMIFMPPRHGKSELASRSFPAWFLGRNPSKQIIAASYNSELAGDFGREVRNIVNSPDFQNVFGDVKLSQDSQAADRWHTNKQGSYVAAGVGTAITGRGADVLLIDDPVKDREEADSDIKRKRVKDWYTSTAYTRLMPGGAIVIIQTRWHEDDLAGWLLDESTKGGEQWHVVSLPAIDSGGNALWPNWYGLDRLEAIRSVIGARDWSALYQQSPVPDGGGAFRREWFQFYEERPEDVAKGCNLYMLIDAANEKRKTSDYTAIWVVALNEDGNYYAVDIVRDRLNLTQRGDLVMRLHRKWKPKQVRYERYGLMADVQYIKTLQGQDNYRFEIVEVGGQTAKIDRIKRLVPIMESRKFYLPNTLYKTDSEGKLHDLVSTFIEEEALSFPVSRHDDMLDSLSRVAEPDMALIWPQPIPEPPKYDRYKRSQRTSPWTM